MIDGCKGASRTKQRNASTTSTLEMVNAYREQTKTCCDSMNYVCLMQIYNVFGAGKMNVTNFITNRWAACTFS